MAVCKYRSVSERDMDLLFMEAFATDHVFSKIFLEKTALGTEEYTVLQTERSKIDNGLGESDLTVIFEINGLKHRPVEAIMAGNDIYVKLCREPDEYTSSVAHLYINL